MVHLGGCFLLPPVLMLVAPSKHPPVPAGSSSGRHSLRVTPPIRVPEV